MDVVVAVILSLLVVVGVFLTMYSIATLSHHEEGETESKH